ncbi:hypothetical protein HMPREF9318_00113 [Streptococcus urinalis FB127-CNA-2]|nr:hypothetical protein HMPREF9318_00113 [Streptococcus urinalis FB127-CNA-2]VEF31728.1 Uncharacterised protein [Streptococcus urinalis]VTS39740.1 Uncharacterised protein [Streptococcus porcinus]
MKLNKGNNCHYLRAMLDKIKTRQLPLHYIYDTRLGS